MRTETANLISKHLKQFADFFNVDMNYLHGRHSMEKGEQPENDSIRESRVIDMFRSLNEEGKEKSEDYLHDLISSGKYKKGYFAEVLKKKHKQQVREGMKWRKHV